MCNFCGILLWFIYFQKFYQLENYDINFLSQQNNLIFTTLTTNLLIYLLINGVMLYIDFRFTLEIRKTQAITLAKSSLILYLEIVRPENKNKNWKPSKKKYFVITFL